MVVNQRRVAMMVVWVLAVASPACLGVGAALPSADGGPSADAAVDAGTPDGGALDAGSDAGADAGRVVDAGPPVGHPVPGCVDAGDATLTAAERTLLGLPADSWYEAPNTKLYEVCKTASTFGDGVYLVQGCAAIVNAWSGGAFDSQRQRMMIWGGGHNDYGGNEVYAFDVKTMTWSALTTPSRPPFGKDPLDDGRPVSRHTYDGVEFIEHRGTLFAWGGARSTDGNGTVLTWEFDPDARAWTNLDAGPPAASSTYDFGMAYDVASKKVFLHSHEFLSSYDFATNRWTKLKDFGYPPYTHLYDTWHTRIGAVDRAHGLFITLGGTSAVLAYDIAADKVVSMDAPWTSLTGGAGLTDRQGPGLDYDLAAGQLVGWAGGSPQALDLTLFAFVPRSAVGAPAKQTSTGTYGRWRYLERYNVFLLVNDVGQNVYFYKHTAGCGE